MGGGREGCAGYAPCGILGGNAAGGGGGGGCCRGGDDGRL